MPKPITSNPTVPARVTPSPRTHLVWGNERFSLEKSAEGFSRISGTTGAGKTNLLKLHLLDVLPEVEHNPNAKLVLYDPQRELYAWLLSLGLKSPIQLFLPSDERSAALDFAEDYSDQKDGRTLAHAFYPESIDQGESPFWGNSLRTIYAGVYLAIKARLGHADLRLMCLVLEDDELTRAVLGGDPYLVQARKLTAVTGKSVSETVENIHTNVQSRIGEMKELAAHLDCAARERPLVSLRRFLQGQGSGILVISKDDDYGISQDPMNGVLFLRLTQLVAKLPRDKHRRIFVVIDEFPALCGEKHRCPGVKTMFTRLRTRGAIPLITDQGETTLKPIYKDDTTAVVGQCSNVIILRQPDNESAEAASKALGTERGWENKTSFSYGGDYTHMSLTPHYFDRTIVPASDLQNLPLSSQETGIRGWAKSAHRADGRPYPVHIDPSAVAAIPETLGYFEEYRERHPDTQFLRPLRGRERQALLKEPATRRSLETYFAALESAIDEAE